MVIENFTKKKDIVPDPFAGTGTNGIAAQNTGRSWILIEKDPDYWKFSNSRLRKNKK